MTDSRVRAAPALLLDSLLAARALDAAEDRRSVARVALTSFGRDLRDEPSELATADPDALTAAARFAIDEGLAIDREAGDLAPREPPPPALCAALYELTAALPRGPHRTELGRQVATLLLQGPAATFAAIATRMARTGARGLAGPGVEARIALATFLPLEIDGGIDAFALALATQRELAASWVIGASTRSLPERRLAARLLLRATREATRRARRGDGDAIAALLADVETSRRSVPPPPARGVPSTVPPPAVASLPAAWTALIGERESAVWRWAAAARGLLAASVEGELAAIERGLAPDAGGTAWRRAACALGASVATSDDDAFIRAVELARSPIVARDPGVASALVWGLAAAADAEPEACDEVLAEVAAFAPFAVAEPLVDLRREVAGSGDRARLPCRTALTASLERGDDDLGRLALAREVRDDLDGTSDRKLQRALDEALAAFEWTGAPAAYARAGAALAAAEDLVARLEALGEAAADVRYWEATPLVREVDVALLESRVLPALLALGARGNVAGDVSASQALDDRLAALLLAREAREEDGAARQPTHHHRNLRALIHLVDVDTSDLTVDERRRDQLRLFWERVAQATSTRLTDLPGSPLARAVAATLARTLDALVRNELADAADVWLYAASQPWAESALATLSEASRNPDVASILEPAASFSAQVHAADVDGASVDDPALVAEHIAALARLAAGIPAGISLGSDHLRRALGRLARDLSALGQRPDVDLVDSIGRELESLRPLVVAAVQRCSGRVATRPRRQPAPPAAATRIAVDGLAEWASRSEDLPRDVVRLVAAALRLAAARLPESEAAAGEPIATEGGVVFQGAGSLARTATPREEAPAAGAVRGAEGPALPPWIPRRRTLGGYYVHRQIGGGAAGSVFLVSRFDEHDDPAAERFALKVPVWDAATSRTLSEPEFLRLFRQEASALMEIPEHPNLARFVTFDAGARPKPILVMELVEGPSCEERVAAGGLDVGRAADLLDGVCAGLVAMHAVGVGHLDVKPSNVIVREGGVPVLVDFGLAGRRIRPGCGTVAYGAPEVWLEKADASPLPTDVYAFACLAFELLTGRPLFAAPSDHAIVAAHLTQDGDPPGLATLLRGEALRPVAALLSECLRRAPERRPTILDVRRRLGAHRGALMTMSWPIR